MTRVTKLLGSLVFYLLSESWRFVCKVVGRNPRPIVTCVYYHHVLGDERERFAAQMDHLVRWTKPWSSTAQIAGADGHYTLVTADDGWKSFADNAVPELVKREIPLTMFVIADRLGQTVDDIEGDRIVSEKELRNLARVVTIGSHTATHPRMSAIPEAEARRELSESRAKLEHLVGGPVTSLCFPYGAFNHGLVTLAHECGYQQIYVGIPLPGSTGNAPIGRFRVDPSDWKLEFHLKIVGAYRWVPKLIGLRRKMLGFKRDQRDLGLDRLTSV